MPALRSAATTAVIFAAFRPCCPNQVPNSATLALLRGSVPYEFRTTVVKGLHTRASLLAAAQWIAGADAYYLQQFKDSGDLVAGGGLSAFGEDELRQLAEAVKTIVPHTSVRGV